MIDFEDCVKIYPLDDDGKLLKKPKRNPKRKLDELVQEISIEPMEPTKEDSIEPMEPTKEDKEVQVQPHQPLQLLTFPFETMEHFFQLWKAKFPE